MNAKTPNLSTKDALIDAAIRVFSARPSASLSDVAEEAGVKRVTLHRLIGSRDDLLNSIALRSLEEMETAAEEAMKSETTAVGMLRAMVAALVPIADRCHFLWQHPSIWESENLAKEIERQNSELGELIDHAKLEGSVAIDIPNAWILASMEAIVYTALTTSRSGAIATNDAADLAVRTFFHGIAPSTHSAKSKPKRQEK